MTASPEPTTADEQVNHQPVMTLITTQTQSQPEPQLDTEEDPTRKAITNALEQINKNLETTMNKWDTTINKWDTLGGGWGSILFEELARSCKELEEVAELIKGRMDSAESM